MTARNSAALNAGDFERNNFFAEERDKPPQRTNEFEIQIAPAHVVREAQIANDFREESLENFGGRFSLFANHGVNVAVTSD